MHDRIFEAYAPTYWQHELPVIPLRHRNKMPDINQWSLYGRQMPAESEQAHWLASYPKGNIGLPLGPWSGVCIIDIDTEDAHLDEAIRDICGPTPWVRVGKKGAALAYRFEGQKNFKLRGAGGGMICEFLGLGNQVVLPPSIHPDTGLPYTATADLWNVKDELPFLGEDIEDKLRALLGQKGFEIGAGGRSSPVLIVPAGERDVQMIRHAGYLARVVLGIDKSTKFSLMEALGHMHHWVENYTARVSGDTMDPEKGVAKLLEFLLIDIEKGRTMPSGWDTGLTDDLREHEMINKIAAANQGRRWTLKTASDWLNNRINEKPDDLDWMAESVDELIRLVAGDPHFSDGHFFSLIAYIKRHCKPLGLGDRALKHMLSRARAGLESDDRVEAIAEMVSNGLAHEATQLVRRKRLLQLLGEVDDDQLLILNAYGQSYGGDGSSAWERVDQPEPTHMQSSKDEVDRDELYRLGRENLLRLGLLRRNYGNVKTGELPTFDHRTGHFKHTVEISSLGRMLLREISIEQPLDDH